jgi:hypothetical protein
MAVTVASRQRLAGRLGGAVRGERVHGVVFAVRPQPRAVEDVIGAEGDERHRAHAARFRSRIDGKRVDLECAPRLALARVDVMERGTVDHDVGPDAIEQERECVRILDRQLAMGRREHLMIRERLAQSRAELSGAADDRDPAHLHARASAFFMRSSATSCVAR